MKDRLHELPNDPLTCPLEDLTLPVSGEFISRPSWSMGGKLLTDSEKLSKQRQLTKIRKAP